MRDTVTDARQTAGIETQPATRALDPAFRPIVRGHEPCGVVVAIVWLEPDTQLKLWGAV